MGSASKPPTGKDRGSREARERARIYQARTTFHAGRARRRTRDNWIAGIVGGVLIAGAVGSQFAVYGSGPFAPVPEPSTSVSPSPAPTTTQTPAPTPSITP